MPVVVPAVPTIGEIARRLGVAVHRVEYVVWTRNLKPAARAGNLRVFLESDIDYIASELRRIDADRGGSLL
jgi:DNA-binding transcriptional MerR regulator